MNIFCALLLNFLPLIVCFFVFKYLAGVKFSVELLSALFGLLAVLPITFLQFYILTLIPDELYKSTTDMFGLFCKILVFNGLLEEGMKAIFISFIPHKTLDLKRFFWASVLCGLCLGCFESAVYFMQHLARANQTGAELLYGLIFVRMFSATLIHAFCAGLSGLFVWSIRQKKTDTFPIIYAVLCHGIFNFFVYFNNFIHWFSVIAVLFVMIECRVHYQKFLEASEPAKKTEKAPVRKKTTSKSKATDATLVTKAPSKVKSQKTSKTKTRARKAVKASEPENIEAVDVTPELND